MGRVILSIKFVRSRLYAISHLFTPAPLRVTHMKTTVDESDLAGERHCDSNVSCPITQRNVPGQDSNPLDLETSALTIQTPRLPHDHENKGLKYLKIKVVVVIPCDFW